MTSLRMVALGGGGGLYSTLTALRRITPDVTAVVTVADDGGSSGRLRKEFNLLPPGDIRQALAALASADPNGLLWAELLQHRFGGNGDLAGHAVGNLLLAGLFDVLGDPVAALDEVCRLLGISGRVLPMSRDPLDIAAEVSYPAGTSSGTIQIVRGQAEVARTGGQVQQIMLTKAGGMSGAPQACREAVDAVLRADVVFLGPGSWFTSVLPHLLVPELHDALVRTKATKIVILNLIPQPGETEGFSPERHLDVLFQHAPELRVDAVIADLASVSVPDRLRDAAAGLGAKAYLGTVADRNEAGRHDPDALATCVREALGLTDEPEEEMSWR